MARRKVDVLSERDPLADEFVAIDGVVYPPLKHGSAALDPRTGEPMSVRFMPTGDVPPSVLDEAAGIVHGARQAAYGHPRDNHACTAQLWTAYLRRCGVLKDDAEITPRQVCIANALQKCSRDAHEEKRDNLVDLAGWAANAEMVDE